MEYKIKDLLIQYDSLIKEKESVKRTICKLEKRILEMEGDKYTERDTVSGGNGGKQHYVIEGFPYPEYSKKKTMLMLRKAHEEELLEKIEEQITYVEQYINQIQSSSMRRMITYRYIEGYSWIKVAHSMGNHYTADGCRMAVERFLKEK